MRILYDLILFLYSVLAGLAALFGNQKAKLWVEGRTNWEEKISKAMETAGKNRIWFHCASLGEFEQGRPIIEKLKSHDSSIFIILSFFSPSGYELRKNYSHADLICYLPIDNKKNAQKFIQLTSPVYVVFIKYEFWIYYFEELYRKNIPLYLASAIFRPSQLFFKWHGRFYRNALNHIKHFFVQDENSAILLKSLGFENTSVTGDTRFDRVKTISKESKVIPLVETFRQNKKLLAAGSTWAEDEDILLYSFNNIKSQDYKIIIAPHEINEARINSIVKKASEYFRAEEIIRYSRPVNPESARVLILDNIGMLSAVYRYSTLAWIGGGFGKGIHNILEASVYGIPVIFGPNYKRFREAVDLVTMKGAYSIDNKTDAVNTLEELINNESIYTKSSTAALNYVNSNLGSTDKIIALLPDTVVLKQTLQS